jgi:hypothetical protein
MCSIFGHWNFSKTGYLFLFVLFHHKGLLQTFPHLFLQDHSEFYYEVEYTMDSVPTEKKPQQAAKAIKRANRCNRGHPLCHFSTFIHSIA